MPAENVSCHRQIQRSAAPIIKMPNGNAVFAGSQYAKTVKPVGYNYQVYHPGCLPKVQEKINEQAKIQREPEAPSLSLKIIAWCFMVMGIVAFGTALLLLGFSWFGQSVPIRALISGPVAPNLDSIPGGRVVLYWVAGLAVFCSAGGILMGVGLLNCVAATRRLLLLFAWLEVIVDSLAWLVVLGLGHGFWDIPVIGIFLIIYLTRKNVKRQFEKVL